MLNQEKIRTLKEKKNCNSLGMFEANAIREVDMKEKNRKEFFRRRRRVFETKLC